MGYHHPRYFRPFGYKTWAAVGADCKWLNRSLQELLDGKHDYKANPGYEVKLCNGQIVRVRKLSEERQMARGALKWRNDRQPQELPYWMKTPPVAPPSEEEQRRFYLQSPRKDFYLSAEEQNRLDSRNSR